jgi:hypothetical protein
VDFLRAQASSAYQAYQATRYDAAGRILPGLIRGVETAAQTTGTASPAASAVRARVYDAAAALLSRVGEPFLAWAAADRALFAAGQSGDPLLAAASAWRMSYMITGRKHPHEALDLAMAAAARKTGDHDRAARHEHLAASYQALRDHYQQQEHGFARAMTDRQEWDHATAGSRCLAIAADTAATRTARSSHCAPPSQRLPAAPNASTRT